MTMTFEKMQIDPYNERILKLCRRYAKRFGTMLADNRSLLFWGNVGTGKSCAAFAIANHLLKDGFTVQICTLAELLEQKYPAEPAKPSGNEKTAPLDLFIIDGINGANAPENALRGVCSFIEERNRLRLPMIFITSLTLAEMQRAPDELHHRLYSAILSTAYPLQFTGKNRHLADHSLKNADN
jgi:DNA replication protein DnaC